VLTIYEIIQLWETPYRHHPVDQALPVLPKPQSSLSLNDYLKRGRSLDGRT
jgi:hypothetical protein